MAPKHHLKYGLRILLILGLLSLPLYGSAASIRLVELILIYIIAGMGLQLLTGQAGLISLGQVGFMAIGAYATAYLLQSAWPLALAMLVGVLLSALLGILLAIPANRLTGPYLAIISLAFGIGISTWISHTNWLGASSGMRVAVPPQLQEESLYFLVVIISIVAYGGASVLRSSKWGLRFLVRVYLAI
ncbi:MAG: branched-chain amino acid ABC transporter permease, partial [Bacteroidota bacterium]